MPIIAQGIYGGVAFISILTMPMEFWVCACEGRLCSSGALYPNEKPSAEAAGKNREKPRAAAGRFVDAPNSERPKSLFFRLMIFRTTRSSMKYFEDALS